MSERPMGSIPPCEGNSYKAEGFLFSCEAFMTHSNVSSLSHMHRTLLTMLTLFSKFHNPKAFYKQEEIWQLFLKVCRMLTCALNVC